ncbi:MAG: hypothetical protein AAGF12_24160 [Myxococcota bacterium]
MAEHSDDGAPEENVPAVTSRDLPSRRTIARALGAWFLVTALGALGVSWWSSIPDLPPPSEDARSWAFDALHAARFGEPIPDPPVSAEGVEGRGPTFIIAWREGISVARVEASPGLVAAVEEAAAEFQADPDLGSHASWTAPRGDGSVRFSIQLTAGFGPLFRGIPYVEELGLVPLEEGLRLRLGDRTAYATPDELQEVGAYEAGVITPVPDFSFGTNVAGVVDRLTRQLGLDPSEAASGSVDRFRVLRLLEDPYPDPTVELTEEALREAAVEGVEMLLRHQKPDGTYTYLYDGRTGQGRNAGYNLPRHSGTTYFVAQVHHLHGMPEARQAAIRALQWINTHRMGRCGGADRWCVHEANRADMGASALTALAAAEVLASGDDPFVRQLLEGLTEFIRAQQRPDGELMHEYDLTAQEPIDVQRLFYSGEASFALLRAHRFAEDERNLEAAKRVMAHLTGAGWDFFGSRYYYGEDHWTCIAQGESYDRLQDAEALDFCRRWASWNQRVQYDRDDTRFLWEGGYGVGPFVLPRLTPVGSRTEAFISTYEASRAAGIDDPELRQLVERALLMLLRYRWAPGPAHLLQDPAGARGGIPTTEGDLLVRNDFIQHAGSAMIRWADWLRREKAMTQSE